jgi:hypothetical protein
MGNRGSTAKQNVTKSPSKKSRSRLSQLREMFNGLCSRTKIQYGDENLSMFYIKKHKLSKENRYIDQEDRDESTHLDEKIHLFNIFNFKPTMKGVDTHKLFLKLYDILFNEVKESLSFIIFINDEGKIEIQAIFDDDAAKLFKSYLKPYFLPYLLYIFANNKIDLNEEDGLFDISIQKVNNEGSPALSGIHQDRTERTCLTFVDSQVSTELAFNLKELKLKGTECSPIFRFNTKHNFYTLCFNDEYMVHTIPIWEDEIDKVSPSELNAFEYPYKMTREGDKMHFGFDEESYEDSFLVQKHRKKLSGRNQARKVIISFATKCLYTVEDIPSENKGKTIISTTFEPLILKHYKKDSLEEEIELTEDSIHSIVHKSKLGSRTQLAFTGGKTQKRKL